MRKRKKINDTIIEFRSFVRSVEEENEFKTSQKVKEKKRFYFKTLFLPVYSRALVCIKMIV